MKTRKEQKGAPARTKMLLQTVVGRCYLLDSFEVHLDGCYIWLVASFQTKESGAEKVHPNHQHQDYEDSPIPSNISRKPTK